MLKKFFRKAKHVRYVNRYIVETRWEIINYVIANSSTGIPEGRGGVYLENLGQLIKKYERRRRWLKF